jgi:hypothetical protein
MIKRLLSFFGFQRGGLVPRNTKVRVLDGAKTGVKCLRCFEIIWVPSPRYLIPDWHEGWICGHCYESYKEFVNDGS